MPFAASHACCRCVGLCSAHSRRFAHVAAVRSSSGGVRGQLDRSPPPVFPSYSSRLPPSTARRHTVSDLRLLTAMWTTLTPCTRQAKMRFSLLNSALLLLAVTTQSVQAGPLAYAVCQAGYSAVVVACYSAAGFTSVQLSLTLFLRSTSCARAASARSLPAPPFPLRSSSATPPTGPARPPARRPRSLLRPREVRSLAAFLRKSS